ncbi:hypothetical protein [Pedobacter arcticus]|uniref:hypothetical protein n=1 Tax=Pedobacter arcticus TaxID=752140 RepID=UPI0002F93575|nr:hypothetical protein [Pedobacter arcticus]
MKKLSLLIFLLASAVTGFAQSQSDSNYSLGFKLLSVDEQPKLLNEVRDNATFYTSGLNGLMLKINDNQISYRFSAQTFKKTDYTFINECSNCEIVEGKYNSLDLKIGFERSISYSRLQPFYGLDLGFKKATFDGISTDKTSSTFRYNVNIEKNAITVNPFIGLKFNIIRALTLSAEAGFDFIKTYDKEIKTTDTNMMISSNNFDRWQYNSRPLAQLSLQFNFGTD